jgi:hypothetical protein
LVLFGFAAVQANVTLKCVKFVCVWSQDLRAIRMRNVLIVLQDQTFVLKLLKQHRIQDWMYFDQHCGFLFGLMIINVQQPSRSLGVEPLGLTEFAQDDTFNLA